MLVPAFPLEVVSLPQGGTTDRGGANFTLFSGGSLIGGKLMVRFKEIKKTKPRNAVCLATGASTGS